MGDQIVVCGSMSVLPLMHRLADWLRSVGVAAVVPEPDDDPLGDAAAAVRCKAAASRKHFDTIRSGRTAAVLVVNVDRQGQRDYVGPNAFAEAAVAFAERRPVYLLQGMPSAYRDELTALGATCLSGDLRRLLADLGADQTSGASPDGLLTA
jgi:hypothetical protein